MGVIRLAKQAKATLFGAVYLVAFIVGGCIIRKARLARVGQT